MTAKIDVISVLYSNKLILLTVFLRRAIIQDEISLEAPIRLEVYVRNNNHFGEAQNGVRLRRSSIPECRLVNFATK